MRIEKEMCIERQERGPPEDGRWDWGWGSRMNRNELYGDLGGDEKAEVGKVVNEEEKEMIYTSYFAMAHKVEDKDKLLSIALWPPKNMRIQCMPYLAPTKEMLLKYKEDHDEESYTKTYQEKVLGALDVDKVATYLQGRILLCYERPEAFCHRHIVAQWLNDNGYGCEEMRF